MDDVTVTSGKIKVSGSMLCLLAIVCGGAEQPRLGVPAGFSAALYARGIAGARDLSVRQDGSLTLRGNGGDFEIVPAGNGAPLTVLRVATDLDRSTDETSPGGARDASYTRPTWVPAAHVLNVRSSVVGADIPISPRLVALSRTLVRSHHDVALAPDGSLFVADARTGTVWRVRASL